jgi:hypothetical protein
MWIDGLERAKQENLKLSAKEKRELLEAACHEIVATIPRYEPVKPKEKPLRYITVEEMKARLVEVEARLIETFLSEGWSESEIAQEFEWLENLRQSRLRDAVRARVAETPIRGSSCHPYRETGNEPDLEVETVQ